MTWEPLQPLCWWIIFWKLSSAVIEGKPVQTDCFVFDLVRHEKSTLTFCIFSPSSFNVSLINLRCATGLGGEEMQSDANIILKVKSSSSYLPFTLSDN